MTPVAGEAIKWRQYSLSRTLICTLICTSLNLLLRRSDLCPPFPLGGGDLLSASRRHLPPWSRLLPTQAFKNSQSLSQCCDLFFDVVYYGVQVHVSPSVRDRKHT